MGHNHSNHHSGKNLKIAFFLNLGFTVIEIFGGIYTNSIAIISDAIHDLGDSLSLGLSWYLDKKSKKTASGKFTFGYNRLSLLGALINSLILIAGSVYVILEAVGRLIDPEVSDADGMIVFALFGILVNGYAAWKLSGGRTLNEKVISWHLIEDVLGWFAILLVAIVLKFKSIPYLDPALSLFITVYILWNVVKRLRETFFIFLQAVPYNVNINEIENRLLAIENIQSVHHTHVWSLDGEQHVFTTHIKLKNISSLSSLMEVKNRVKNELKIYHFKHYTIETELETESCELENKSI